MLNVSFLHIGNDFGQLGIEEGDARLTQLPAILDKTFSPGCTISFSKNHLVVNYQSDNTDERKYLIRFLFIFIFFALCCELSSCIFLFETEATAFMVNCATNTGDHQVSQRRKNLEVHKLAGFQN